MEFNYNKLKGKIKEVFNTQDNFAKALGVGRVTVSQRLNNHSEFTQTEIYNACKLLNISLDEINEYFFKYKVKKTKLNKAG